MVWGYLFGRLSARALHTDVSLPWLILMGAVPDYDILFQPLGLQHHTISHSVFAWLLIFVFVVWRWRRRAIAYWIGAVQHLLGDYLVTNVPLALPISDVQVGLNLGMPSASDSLLEVGGLGFMLLLLFVSGDWGILMAKAKSNLWMIIPLVTLLGLSLSVSLDLPLPLVQFAFSRHALSVITLGHGVLGLLLGVSLLQGLRLKTD